MSIRFEEDERLIPRVRIENVGHGTAVNVDLLIRDASNYRELRRFRAFALREGGGRTTNISFIEHPRILLSGSYQNVRRDVINEYDVLFDFENLREGL